MTPRYESSAARIARDRVLFGLFALAFLTALVLIFGLERGDPLWLDEAWTIAVAGQRTWVGFFHQVYWDVNAPLYQLVIHLWQGVFGLSDLSLRIPSLVMALATPLVLASRPIEGLPTAERLAWAAITALWFPLLSYAQEARCYAMLMLLGTLQCLAFLALMREPTTRRAAVWAVLGALSILTHYDAILAAGVQGLVYVAVHRMRAVKTWPAALAYLPAFAWLAYHLPRIAEFARPDIAWYSLLKWSDTELVAGFLVGRKQALWGLLAVAVGALAVRFAWRRRERPDPVAGYLWWAEAAAVLAAAILIVAGFFRPSFAYRYLTPEAPGILLGLVLTARALVGRRVGIALAGLIVAFGAVSAWRIWEGDRMAPHHYNYEIASRALEKTHPTRLVFLWDHPVDPILRPEQLQAAGGAFFHRDGDQIPVDGVVLKPGEDPNTRLIAEAQPPGSVILWLYDYAVKGAAASGHRPAIATLDPAWRCRQFAGGRFGVYACARP